MKKIYFSLTCILLAVVSLSCSENSERDKEILINLQTMQSIPLKGEMMEEYLMTPYTKCMKMIQSRLFHFTPTHGTSCLVSNEYADTIGYLPPPGNGPGEFTSSWPDYAGISQERDTLYMYDTSIRTVRKYHLQFAPQDVKATFIGKTKLKEEKSPKQGILDWGINRLKRLDNGMYVGFCDLSIHYTFSLFDEDLVEISKFGEYPIRNVLTGCELYYISVFDGPLEVRGNSIYHATSDFAYMARYDVGEDGKVEKVWSKFYGKTKCGMFNNGIRFKADNIHGFYSLAVGEKYIFAAYSGVESGELHRQRSGMALYPRTLVVFDLDGNPKGKFQLEGRFAPICLDENEEYLYVQHDDPDTSLWRYKVSDILKHLSL